MHDVTLPNEEYHHLEEHSISSPVFIVHCHSLVQQLGLAEKSRLIIIISDVVT